MPRTRLTIPVALRNLVLGEFNHRCAICAADRPQLHHLDQNPGNNDRLNLIPLCPNCHLTDQHNPTHAIQADILRLFRTYKDPVILSPQFGPLHSRYAFLDAVTDGSDTTDLERRAEELTAFVRALKMGRFYGDQLYTLLTYSRTAQVYFAEEGPDQHVRLSDAAAFRRLLRDNRARVRDLIIELLRYQDWPPPRTPERPRLNEPGTSLTG